MKRKRVIPTNQVNYYLALSCQLLGELKNYFSEFCLDLKGKPSSRSKARPSSSLVAVVTTVMFIPVSYTHLRAHET